VGRPHPLARTLNTGEQALHDKRVQLPPEYAAAIKVQLNLSPATVRDPDKAQEWLDIFEFGASATPSAGVRAQLGMDRSQDRLAAYAGITVPSLVIGFADDRLAPAFLGKEVAEAIPGARYAEIERCGHLGYLERPDEVNRVIIDFLLDR
ncbi:alpha/beta fold hydrolase, partial [Nocardia farcinica]|uniref:alpha/beta fold hydrolase n=2 Tax=Nocardia TaxID=1817 RepID=UPI002456BD7B